MSKSDKKQSSLYNSISWKIFPALSKIGETISDGFPSAVLWRSLMGLVIGVIMFLLAQKDTDSVRRLVYTILAVGFIIGAAKTTLDSYKIVSSKKGKI